MGWSLTAGRWHTLHVERRHPTVMKIVTNQHHHRRISNITPNQDKPLYNPTITSVLCIVGPKCTPAASQDASLAIHGEYADGTDGQTDRRQSITLRCPPARCGQRN